MKYRLLSSYPMFLLGTIFASHICQVADAIYIDGMLRLFRGEGNYNDLINGFDATLDGSGGSFPTQTLPTAGAQARQVMYFDGNGKAHGAGTGLPGGDAPRTIIGWIKVDSTPGSNGPFGYGDYGDNNAYYAYSYITPTGVKLEIDQWGGIEGGINPIINPVVVNTWYHVAFSYDGTNNTAYVNGALVATKTPATHPNTQLTR